MRACVIAAQIDARSTRCLERRATRLDRLAVHGAPALPAVHERGVVAGAAVDRSRACRRRRRGSCRRRRRRTRGPCRCPGAARRCPGRRRCGRAPRPPEMRSLPSLPSQVVAGAVAEDHVVARRRRRSVAAPRARDVVAPEHVVAAVALQRVAAPAAEQRVVQRTALQQRRRPATPIAWEPRLGSTGGGGWPGVTTSQSRNRVARASRRSMKTVSWPGPHAISASDSGW